MMSIGLPMPHIVVLSEGGGGASYSQSIQSRFTIRPPVRASFSIFNDLKVAILNFCSVYCGGVRTDYPRNHRGTELTEQLAAAPLSPTPIARSTKNFLEIVDELNELGIEFFAAREAIDTSGPMGRMFITLVGSIADSNVC
jgi:hypothetical protein